MEKKRTEQELRYIASKTVEEWTDIDIPYHQKYEVILPSFKKLLLHFSLFHFHLSCEPLNKVKRKRKKEKD